jgi:hypothetical protein
MSKDKGLLSNGLSAVTHNKRYIFWFWLLNLTLAEFGTAAFRKSAHATLDHSLYANGLMHGFDTGVLGDMLFRPQFGQMSAMSTPALYFAFLFFVAAALFLPGVFAGYASTYRLPRQDFFRACGRNLWSFIRLLIMAGVVMGVFAGALFALNAAIVKKAGDSTNELLPFKLQISGLALIFLIMTTLRIWFDLAEADIVLSDRRAVRKSVAAAFRHTFRNLGRLLASYVVITIVAAIILLGGLWTWHKLVAPESVGAAFLVAQFTLFLLLIPRFWQRGVAVTYWQQKMLMPVVPVLPIIPQPISDFVPPPAPPAPPALPLVGQG